MAEANVKPLIRLVDDEVDQLTALEMLLTGQGWDVAAYTGAREFLTSDMPSRPHCRLPLRLWTFSAATATSSRDASSTTN